MGGEMSNPPAFPSSIDNGETVKYILGMTLRDYFAAQAMQVVKCSDYKTTAEYCYLLADAMLKAREA
jgi:hypothetical protein